MPWLKYEALYSAILRFVKDKGIRVRHLDLKNGAGGYYDGAKVLITIDSKARNKLDGCYYLLHEFFHYKDHRDGKFPKFFSSHLEYSDENLQLVIDAEMSAIKGGSKELKKWGIDYEPSELTAAGLELTIIFWKKYYFNID